MRALVETLIGWPVAASLALAAVARGGRRGPRRSALNEALHELRRPLQSLVLAAEAGGGASVGASAELAGEALERLEREINGRGSVSHREIFEARPLLEMAVARWEARARRGGGSLALRWQAGRARLSADRFELAQALDNLIVNAIEHGGPSVLVEAGVREGVLRVIVRDSRCGSHPRSPMAPAGPVARLGRRNRRGHGLLVVRRFAMGLGGRFRLRRSGDGSSAELELPLARPRSGLSG